MIENGKHPQKFFFVSYFIANTHAVCLFYRLLSVCIFVCLSFIFQPVVSFFLSVCFAGRSVGLAHVYLSVSACLLVHSVCLNDYLFVFFYLSLVIRLFLTVYSHVYICMYVCMCVYVCMYVCRYVCM